VALSRQSPPTCPAGNEYSGCRTQMDLSLRSRRPRRPNATAVKAEARRLSGKPLGGISKPYGVTQD